MSKLYEYTVTYAGADTDDGIECVVIDATDAGHAYSEMLDELGPDAVIINILRGAERPYGSGH